MQIQQTAILMFVANCLFSQTKFVSLVNAEASYMIHLLMLQTRVRVFMMAELRYVNPWTNSSLWLLRVMAGEGLTF